MENKKTSKGFSVPAWLRLTIISLVAAIGLATTNMLTKDIIAQHASEHTAEALRALMPNAQKFVSQKLPEGSNLLNYSIAQDGDTVLGYIAITSVQGYGGPIEVITAVDTDFKIIGINVGGSEFAETAGLGSLAKEEPFTSQFIGLSTPVTLRSQGGDNTIDAIASATITTLAVTNAVNNTVEEIQKMQE